MGKGPFFAVEEALRSGSAEDALSALKRCSPSAPPWETFLWLGRIEEKRGRFAEAEAALRKAAAADGKGFAELYRLLEDERFSAWRKARLADAARERGGLARLEAGLRASLGDAGRRAELVQLLLSRGRRRSAALELAASLRDPAKGDEAARVALLLELVDGGLYPAELERALLERVARALPADKLATEWPQVFSALMCAGRCEQAFRLGESVLDAFGRFEAPGQLMWPWWRKVRRAVAEDRFIDRELARMRAASRRGPHAHWYAYYRAILLSDASREQEKAMLEYARIKDLDAERYSWMLQSFVLVKLGVPDYPGAVSVSRDILSRAPSHWWVRCRMAEAYMAGGDVAQGLREFEEAGRTCGEALLAEVLTWHGEALLWLGEYGPALEKLDAAVARGAKTFVFGWRGAARFKAGEPARALEDLDRAVAHDPKDFEARGWRAEVLRTLGRLDEADADLEFVVRHGPKNYWIHINRALLRDARGDAAGMAADFGEMPQEMLSLLRRRLKLGGGALSRAAMLKILRSALESARGIRRWEKYVQPIWMERTP